MGHRQLSIFFSRLIFCCLFNLVFAQPATDSLVLPAPWRTARLENGLHIAILQDKSLPLSIVQASVGAGSQWESKRMSGWSCLLSSLLTASNNNFPGPDSFRKALSKEGILFDHFVSPEVLTFRLQGMANHEEWMMSAMVSALQSPSLNALDISNAKDRLIRQAEEDMADPLYYLKTELQTRLWGKEMHRQIATGLPAGLVRADSAGLAFFRKHFFVPYRTLILVVSPDDPDMVQARITRLFGRWQDAASDPEVAFPLPPKIHTDSVEIFTVLQEYATLPIFMGAWRIPENKREMSALLADVLNAPDGSFRRALRDTLKVREVQFQVSGDAMYVTLLPDPRNYLRHGPDSLMLQIRRLCDPGFFRKEEILKAMTNASKLHAQNTERLSDRATHIGKVWARPIEQQTFAEADPQAFQQLAAQIFLKHKIKAGFLSSTNLSNVTGLSDYFHQPLPPDSLDYALEGDTLIADSAIQNTIRDLGYWLNWNPDSKIRIKVYIPSYQVPDISWEIRKVLVESFIRNRLSAEVTLPVLRRSDFIFEFEKDPEAFLPGVSLPLKAEDPVKDAYQFYMVPKAIRFDGL